MGELAVAAVVLAGFVVWERRNPNPMIDVRVFTNRAFSAASGALALTFFALFGSLFVLTQYLQLVHGYSTLAAGIMALPFALAMGAVSPVSSVLAQRFGVRRIVPAGLAMMAGGLWWLSSVTATTGYLHLAIAIVLMGAGMGLIMAPASESIMSALPQEQAGAGSAINDTVREVGGALGVAVVGSIVSAAYRSQLHLGGLPAAASRAARSSVAAADQVAAHAGPDAAVGRHRRPSRLCQRHERWAAGGGHLRPRWRYRRRMGTAEAPEGSSCPNRPCRAANGNGHQPGGGVLEDLRQQSEEETASSFSRTLSNYRWPGLIGAGPLARPSLELKSQSPPKPNNRHLGLSGT